MDTLMLAEERFDETLHTIDELLSSPGAASALDDDDWFEDVLPGADWPADAIEACAIEGARV